MVFVGGRPNTHRPTILVADDDVAMRALLRASLERANYQVRDVEDGRAVLTEPILILTGQDLSAEDRSRLNGKIAGVVQKDGDPRGALQTWMRRASLTSMVRSGAAPEAA